MRPKQVALDILGLLAVTAMIIFGVIIVGFILYGAWSLLGPQS